MPHSVSFVIEGMVPTQVRVTGNLDGTLSFELTCPGGGIGDLRAMLLDLNKPIAGTGFKVFGDTGLTQGAVVAEGIDTLGRAVTLAHNVVDPLGDFDIGIAFGPLDGAQGVPAATGFTLANEMTPLTLDMIDLADFGLRYRLFDTGAAEGLGQQDPGAFANPAARRDVLEVVEAAAARARPLAEDGIGGMLAVIDLLGMRDTRFAEAGRHDPVFGDKGGATGGRRPRHAPGRDMAGSVQAGPVSGSWSAHPWGGSVP